MMKNRPIILLFLLLAAASSCRSKDDSGTNAVLERYFETNVLNRNFIVNLAQDNGTDLTAAYDGYLFMLLESDLYHGPLQATKDGIVYMGNWSSNNDYSKLEITFPAPSSPFGFLSRDWRFTSKKFPTMELAPWGSGEAVVLHMRRQ